MQIAGRTFLVTGAGFGLGAASARMLVAAGGNTVLADVNAPPGRSPGGQLGPPARFLRTDVTDESAVTAAIELGPASGTSAA